MNKKLYKTIINRNTGLIVVVAENKMAVFVLSGSLNNISHKQNERKDELKAKLEQGEISQADYDAQVKRIDRQNLVVNVVAGGLLAPSDSVLGVATSTLAPAASYQVGQYFKEQGKEGSFEHIATHAVIGALTSAANGGNALSGAVSAGGSEYIAQVTANTLFNKKAEDLTADEKQTVSTVAQAIGTLSGSVTGDSSLDAYVGGTVATNAVENNVLRGRVRSQQSETNSLRAQMLEIHRNEIRKIIPDFNGLPVARNMDRQGRGIITQSEVDDLQQFANWLKTQPRGLSESEYISRYESYKSVPPSLSPAGAGRGGAFNKAKRDGNIPVTRQPDFVMPNTDRLGIIQPGRAYYFETGRTVRRENGKDVTYVTYTVIRDDVAGHYWGANNPQNRNQHFNRDEYTYPMVNGRPNFNAKPEITTKYSVHYDY